MSEFDLINQYFKTASVKRNDVVLGIGDDCALLSPPPGKLIAVSTDTLISGVHFPENTKPEDIGYKSLAVNLSDLAAMGAEPAWVSLAISLPDVNSHWLEKFMHGFNELAEEFNVALVGGDTTRGPLSITINVTGFIDEQYALKRSSARPGDLIFVTGTLGDARAGLESVLNNTALDPNIEFCIKRLNRPAPKVMAGQLLRQFGVAAIDLSDGLLADLTHICKASNTGALIKLETLPLSAALTQYYKNQPDWQKIISAGDDYELCFTCPENKLDNMLSVFNDNKIQLTHIGEVTGSQDIQCLMKDGTYLDVQQKGYNHFD